MNEPVTQQAEQGAGPVNGPRSSWTGRFLRVLPLLVLLTAGVIAFFVYQSRAGQTSGATLEDHLDTQIVIEQGEEGATVMPPDVATEVESVVIAEATPEESVPPEQIDLSSITACISQEIVDDAEHPIIPLLEMAEHGVDVITENVRDYTAYITKRVRYKGRLQPEERMFCKIRHASKTDSDTGNATPFSVYTQFIAPKRGQEAIWVDGWHEGKLVAHGPSGYLNLMTVYLDPESKMAMKGNRYPIKTIGMLNLIKQMYQQGKRDLLHDDCEVNITRNLMVNSSRCTKLEVVHQQQADHFDFHRAEIYIDDDRNLPIAFRSFIWPDKEGGRPKLLESYYYTNIKVNVGLTDSDFDPANEAYDYPGL